MVFKHLKVVYHHYLLEFIFYKLYLVKLKKLTHKMEWKKN
jgi:hypothetical protein